MTTSANGPIERAMAIREPRARAKECQQTIDRARETINQLIDIRDEAIRKAKAKGGTIDQIAGDIGVRRNVVVDALRDQGKQR